MEGLGITACDGMAEGLIKRDLGKLSNLLRAILHMMNYYRPAVCGVRGLVDVKLG